MKKTRPAADPDAYVAALDGWRRACVTALRATVRRAAELEECVKWGHLVYFGEGPVLLIRAEEERILFGFWRGQRLLALEPRLAPGGKYEMATLVLREGDTLEPAIARRLPREAVALNQRLGDPRLAARPTTRPKATTKRGNTAKRKAAARRPRRRLTRHVTAPGSPAASRRTRAAGR